MKVFNVHERQVQCSRERATELMSAFGTRRDRVWPGKHWPRLVLDVPFSKDGPLPRGGHGPIRYHATQYVPGERIVFEFEPGVLSRGLVGVHYFEVSDTEDAKAGELRVRHVIDAKLKGQALLLWPLLIRPLHDALIEDLLENFEREAAQSREPMIPAAPPHSSYVRGLRALMGLPRLVPV